MSLRTTTPAIRSRRAALTGALAASLALFADPLAFAQATEADPWSALQDGAIVLFRHAEAPGGGDPPGLRLGDCSTQRNLGADGRAQARRIGEQFRVHRIPVGAVITSQWCRTRETAELAFPGRPRDDPDFNSFFGAAGREPAQTAAALATLNRWRGPGVLVVVTHQVNITALTGVSPASGEGVIVRPHGERIEVVARVRP
jgi:phosphohistidine phosphatase SixA